MGYLIRASNYSERITLFDLNHMMTMVDDIAINVETPRIDSGYLLKKEFIKLICINS